MLLREGDLQWIISILLKTYHTKNKFSHGGGGGGGGVGGGVGGEWDVGIIHKRLVK